MPRSLVQQTVRDLPKFRELLATDYHYAMLIAEAANEVLERRAKRGVPRKVPEEPFKLRRVTEKAIAANRRNAPLGGFPPRISKEEFLKVKHLSKNQQAEALGVSRSTVQRLRVKYREL